MIRQHAQQKNIKITFLSEKISKFVDGKLIVYGTKGKLAIENAFKKEFLIEDVASAKQSVRLPCFAHFETVSFYHRIYPLTEKAETK